MKIYELARGDRFTVPALPDVPVLTFGHMDGMYYCYATTDDGQVCYIGAGVECVRIEAREKVA